MPNYLYVCVCGKSKEVGHSITEDPAIPCPECQTPMTRKPQVAEVSFKGKGFYTTDKNNA